MAQCDVSTSSPPTSSRFRFPPFLALSEMLFYSHPQHILARTRVPPHQLPVSKQAKRRHFPDAQRICHLLRPLVLIAHAVQKHAVVVVPRKPRKRRLDHLARPAVRRRNTDDRQTGFLRASDTPLELVHGLDLVHLPEPRERRRRRRRRGFASPEGVPHRAR